MEALIVSRDPGIPGGGRCPVPGSMKAARDVRLERGAPAGRPWPARPAGGLVAGTGTPAGADRVHARRWAILVVLCLSVSSRLSTTRSSTSPCPRSVSSSARRPATCSGSSTLTPWSSRRCCWWGEPGRPVRAQGRPADRAGGLRRVLGLRRAFGQHARADRGPLPDGPGRGPDLPGHVGHPHQHLHRRQGESSGGRRVDRDHRPRRGARPDHRRPAAPALLLELGLLRYHPHRCAGPGARRVARAGQPRPRSWIWPASSCRSPEWRRLSTRRSRRRRAAGWLR